MAVLPRIHNVRSLSHTLVRSRARPYSSRAAPAPRGPAAQPWLLASLSLAIGGTTAYYLYAAGEQSRQELSCEQPTKRKRNDEQQHDDEEDLSVADYIKKWANLDGLDKVFDDWQGSMAEYKKLFESIQREINREPGSLYDEIVKSAENDKDHPEVKWDAEVRMGKDLCEQERSFLDNRRERMRKTFAKMMDVDESEVDERDLPVVGIAASGGGYRAMVSTLGSLAGAQETSLLDCTTYISAISGSCWALNVLLSLGHGDLEHTMQHVKDRIQTSFLHPETLQMLTKTPTNKYLLSGPVYKESSPGGSAHVVDVYGTLVASRLYVPTDLSEVNLRNLKISHQRKYIQDGELPMPLYCTVRHDVPEEEEVNKADKDVQQSFTQSGRDEAEHKKQDILSQASWQWYELTPFEFGSGDINMWIPTWSLGRLFTNGRSEVRRPELGLTILSGIFSSAFCATLLNYYNEVKPIVSLLPWFDSFDEWITTDYQKHLEAIHPFPPAEIPNLAHGLDEEKRKESGVSEKLASEREISLLDAGALLNVPYVPLFRRACDVIIALDASADSQDLWFTRAESYAETLGIQSWPRVNVASLFGEGGDKEAGEDAKRNRKQSESAANRVDDAKTQERDAAGVSSRTAGSQQSKPEKLRRTDNEGAPDVGSGPRGDREGDDSQGLEAVDKSHESNEPPLGVCNIWLGQSTAHNGDDSDEGTEIRYRNDNPSPEEVASRDGIVLAYLPLRPRPGKKEGDDESGDEAMKRLLETWSTWRFDYSPEETEELYGTCRDNFKDAGGPLRNVLRGVWQRKRDARLKQERESK